MTTLQNFYGVSPTLWVAVLARVGGDEDSITVKIFVSRWEAESWLCEEILCAYDNVDFDDEDNEWSGVDGDDLAEVQDKDSELREDFGLSLVKEIDLLQELPQLAPSADLVLPDAKHLP